MYDHELLLSTLSRFARTLVRLYDVDAVLQELADGVSALLGLVGCGVSLVRDDRLTYATAVPVRVSKLGQAQERTQAGPGVEAWRSGEIVVVPDLSLRTEDWSAYCAAAAEAGIMAVAGIPMCLETRKVGALNLDADGVREWSAEDLAAAQILADMATAYLINASQYGQQQQLNEQLQRALDSRVLIEQAKGIVAATRATSVEEAFDLIRRHARNHHVSLRSVADAIVHVGLHV